MVVRLEGEVEECSSGEVVVTPEGEVEECSSGEVGSSSSVLDEKSLEIKSPQSSFANVSIRSIKVFKSKCT